MEVHARILLPVDRLASEVSSAAAPALCCQPLVVSMAQLLAPPTCPPADAQEMLALWASLPVQVGMLTQLELNLCKPFCNIQSRFVFGFMKCIW